uniref:PTS transporter subunit EIIC n=1 Tax=Clostridium sp. NkU-1 TaxID=1095009 RepID=UPI000A6AF086
MGIQSISGAMEKYIMPMADKMGNECHLRAIRDAFMSLLPITFIGGIAAVISSAPSVETAGKGITLGWAQFVANNSMIFSWINALTLGAMSFYICIGIIHFLCKTRKIESFLPILLGVCGFMMLIAEPLSLGWDGKTVEISFMDGKGLVASMLLSIVTADLYCCMRKREFGKINLPDTVPASLSDVFASIIPGAVLMGLYILVFAVMNKMGTTLPKLIYQMISPSLTAVDNLALLSSSHCWYMYSGSLESTMRLCPAFWLPSVMGICPQRGCPYGWTGFAQHFHHTVLGVFCGNRRMWFRSGSDCDVVHVKI